MDESERVYITVTQMVLVVNIGITIKNYPPFALTLRNFNSSQPLRPCCPLPSSPSLLTFLQLPFRSKQTSKKNN